MVISILHFFSILDSRDASWQTRFFRDFDDPTADVVLISSDGWKFAMHSIVLKTSSQFFNGMFSLPRTSNETGVIPVEESSSTLETLLRMSRGMTFVVPSTGDAVVDVITAAAKYEMPGPLALAKSWLLLQSIDLNPLRLYSCGRRLGLADIEAEGLRRSLDVDMRRAHKNPSLLALDPEGLMILVELRRVRLDIVDTFFTAVSAKLRDTRVGPTAGRCSNCGCDLIDGGYDPRDAENWRKLHWRILKELAQKNSGSFILDRSFENWPEIANGTANFQLVCSASTSYTCRLSWQSQEIRALPTGKAQTLAVIKDIVAGLPVTL